MDRSESWGLLLATAFAVVPGTIHQQESQDQGPERWIADLASKDAATRRRATRNLVAAGGAVLAAIRKALYSSGDDQELRGLAFTLGKLGDPGQELLLEGLGRHELYEPIALVLRRRGAASVPALRKLVLDDTKRRTGAAYVLGRIGDKAAVAVPDLLRAGRSLGPRDLGTDFRPALMRALGSIGATAQTEEVVAFLVTGLTNRDPHVRVEAAFALGRFGVSALEPVLEVAGRLDANLNGLQEVQAGSLRLLEIADLPVHLAPLYALAEIGRPAFPALRTLLRSDQEAERVRACLVLGTMGSRGRELIEPVRKLLASDSEGLRAIAVWVVCRCERDKAKPMLLARLGDKSEHVRAVAIGSLAALGEVGALVRIIESGPGPDRVMAATQLADSVRDSVVLVDAFLGCLGQPDEELRDITTRALVHAVRHGARTKVLAAIRARLSDERLRPGLFRLLADLGPSARPLVPVVTAYLEQPAQRVAVLEILLETGVPSDTEGVLAKLATCLGDPNPKVRALAVRVIGGFGERARPLAAKIEALTKDGNSDVQWAAQWFVHRQARASKASTWVETLETGQANERRTAAHRLGMLAAPGGLRPLAAALDDPDAQVRYWAAWGLTRFESGLEPVAAQLVAALADPLVGVRRFAVVSLGRIGRPAVAPLIAALSAKEADKRQWAAMALERIGKPAEPAVKRLRQLAEDREPMVRYAAEMALRRISGDSTRR